MYKIIRVDVMKDLCPDKKVSIHECIDVLRLGDISTDDLDLYRVRLGRGIKRRYGVDCKAYLVHRSI
jgi:hypothetical protein